MADNKTTTDKKFTDKDIRETDNFSGAHIQIQKFEKELIITAKIKI